MAGEDVETEDCFGGVCEGEEAGEGKDGVGKHPVELSTGIEAVTMQYQEEEKKKGEGE